MEEYGVSFLDIGSCSLHQTHNGFRKGVLDFGLEIENFVNDINFFFKLSPARSQDYKLMQAFTDIEAKYAMRHVSCRWLSIKRPLLRIIEQWLNLDEYFFIFLPKQSNFKSHIKTTNRYQRIVDFMKHPTSKASLCFIAFIANDFEEYLIQMQANEPMIHIMYEKMSSLVFNLMKKIIIRSSLTVCVDGMTRAKQGASLAAVSLSEDQMSLDSIDIGTGAKTILSSSSISAANKEEFRKKCLSFYITTVKYLLSTLPLTSKMLKDAQYLHPDKRASSASLNAISRLSLKIGTTLKNHLESDFDVQESTTVNDVCDMIRSQWLTYQLQDIPKEWHKVETVSAKLTRQQQESYWRKVEKSWLDLTPTETETKSLRIDSYWSRVFDMKDDDGRLIFPQLTPFVKAFLTLSHGNAGPEQGFSINKAILDVHGTNLGEDNIIALRRVKHRLLQVGGVTKFEITRPLINSVKLCRQRYDDEQKALAEKKKKQKKGIQKKN